MFLKMYDIFGVLDFLYLLQTLQQILVVLTYLDPIENVLTLICNSFYIH